MAIFVPKKASQIKNTPAGNISATNVQDAINELDTEKQPVLGYTPENVSNKGIANGYCGLDTNALIPLANIPQILTGKDADTVDGYHHNQSLLTTASPSFVGLTLSGLTAGSILFVGAGGVISQSNSDLFWDNTNKRLGIGTTAPNYKLSVIGSIYASDKLVSSEWYQPGGGQLTIQAQATTYPWGATVLTIGTNNIHTNSSGQTYLVKIGDIYNQSGTAANTDLLIQRTEISLGSGAQYLIMAGTSAIPNLFSVTNTGQGYFSGSIGIGIVAPNYKCHVNGTFGFAPGSSVTPANNGDVVIEATSDTTLTFKLKGSDGVVRTGTITLA